MVVCLVRGGVPGPRGWCTWSGGAGVPGLGGVWCAWGVGGLASQHALRQTPLWTESQTPVKTLPWPNFVAAGKYAVNFIYECVLLIIQSLGSNDRYDQCDFAVAHCQLLLRPKPKKFSSIIRDFQK